MSSHSKILGERPPIPVLNHRQGVFFLLFPSISAKLITYFLQFKKFMMIIHSSNATRMMIEIFICIMGLQYLFLCSRVIIQGPLISQVNYFRHL
jgi:hypothetical protein